MGEEQFDAERMPEAPFRSLYRRFRPGRFQELKGQPHVVLALQSAVRDGHVSHAYLFSGPRGTGKTSTARILARALNCEKPEDGEPCGVCTSCVEIARGTSLDVHELDAASNNGVDAMRDLVAHSALGTPGRWKIYIVDEVHMLSNAAANALLKTLEEPPAHVIFVLATTDPQKVPPTIRSRTQHFEFRLLGSETLGDLLRNVSAQAALDLDDDAIAIAIRRAKGSARDALSALDQVAASGSSLDVRPELAEVFEAIYEEDGGRVLVAIASLHEAGWGPTQLAVELVDELRQGFLVALAPELAAANGEELERLSQLGDRLGLPRLVRAMEVLGRCQVEMRDAPDPRVVLEVAMVRLARPDVDDSVGALADRLDRLERLVNADGVAHRPSPAVPSAGPTSPPARTERPPSPPPTPAPTLLTAAPTSAPSSTSRPDPHSQPALGALRRQRRQGQSEPDVAVPIAEEPAVAAAVAPTVQEETEQRAAPDRDTLVQAWGDHILRGLPGRAKALYSAGRFLSIEGSTARFALPNEAHRLRCEEVRDTVEEKLAAHFSARIGLELVVDSSSESNLSLRPEAPANGPTQPATSEPHIDDEDFDPDDPGMPVKVQSLAEARLLEAFPGAEQVSE